MRRAVKYITGGLALAGSTVALLSADAFDQLRLTASVALDAVAAVMAPARPPGPAALPSAAATGAASPAALVAPTVSPPTASSSAMLPTIDVARIDADGVSVVAGSAAPGASVVVHANGREIASAVASSSGQWSAVVSETFTPGVLELSLRARAPGEAKAIHGKSLKVTIVPGKEPRPQLASATRQLATVRPPDAAQGEALEKFRSVVEQARAAAETGAATGRSDAAPPASAVLPVPVTFVTGQVAMTGPGIQAAALLADYLRLMKTRSVTLTGHADERGTDGYNMELSRRRLEAIEAFLRREGYKGRLTLLAKGEQEPFQGIDRRGRPVDEVLQADRRVELRLAD